MSTASAPRLWIQATARKAESRQVGPEALGTVFLATLASSGVGALIKTAADRLLADNEFTLSDTLAFDPAFHAAQTGGQGEFLVSAITLNVGPQAVTLEPDGQLSEATVIGAARAGIPVLVRVEFVPSLDGTALAGRVTHWVYQGCLDARTALRASQRKVSIEIKITDAAGASLLATAMQVTATVNTLAKARPAQGERLPWARKPGAVAPAGAVDGRFGPVNIQVRITEAAAPSWLGRLLGNTLSAQKAAVETLVKDAVTQALDPSAAAQAQLGSIEAAQTAWTAYATAHQKAAVAREAFDKAGSAANQQALVLALAVLAERLTLAREAHGRAALTMQSLPAVAAP